MKGLVEVAGLNFVRSFIGGKEGDLSHQFANECRARSTCALDQVLAIDVAERQTLGVELDQTQTAGVVGQRDFDRLVDAAGACRECRFEDVGAIGC